MKRREPEKIADKKQTTDKSAKSVKEDINDEQEIANEDENILKDVLSANQSINNMMFSIEFAKMQISGNNETIKRKSGEILQSINNLFEKHPHAGAKELIDRLNTPTVNEAREMRDWFRENKLTWFCDSAVVSKYEISRIKMKPEFENTESDVVLFSATFTRKQDSRSDDYARVCLKLAGVTGGAGVILPCISMYENGKFVFGCAFHSFTKRFPFEILKEHPLWKAMFTVSSPTDLVRWIARCFIFNNRFKGAFIFDRNSLYLGVVGRVIDLYNSDEEKELLSKDKERYNAVMKWCSLPHEYHTTGYFDKLLIMECIGNTKK